MPKGRIRKRHSLPLDIKLYVIKRDKCTCQYCGKKGVFIFRYAKPCVVENPKNIHLISQDNYNGKDVISFEIDHILALCDGGTNTIDNLALSCRKCNRGKEIRTRNGDRTNA